MRRYILELGGLSGFALVCAAIAWADLSRHSSPPAADTTRPNVPPIPQAVDLDALRVDAPEIVVGGAR